MAPTSIFDRVTPEQLARIRLRYEESEMTLAEIGREEGFTEDQIQRLRRRFQWPSRSERKRKAVQRTRHNDEAIAQAMATIAADETIAVICSEGAGDAARDSAHKLDSAEALDVARAARALLVEQLAAIRSDPDRAQKTLAALSSFSRSLSGLNVFETDALKKAGVAGQTNDEPPLDLAELRRELVRRLDRMRAERRGS
jgi:hypothetical protein